MLIADRRRPVHARGERERASEASSPSGESGVRLVLPAHPSRVGGCGSAGTQKSASVDLSGEAALVETRETFRVIGGRVEVRVL
jgi:hypothetical protein